MTRSPRPNAARARHPVLFAWFVVAVVSVPGALVATVLVTNPQWPWTDGPVAAGTVVAVGLATVLVLVGDVLPAVQHLRGAPQGMGMRWSPAFLAALLAFAGIVPALAAALAGMAASCLLYGARPSRVATNLGVVTANVLTGWGVLTALGWQASMTEPWAPSSAADLLTVLLCVLAMVVCNDVLIVPGLWMVTGQPILPQAAVLLRLYRAGGSFHQLAVTPVVVVVMANAPVLTLLTVLPVTAVHRALAAQQQSAHVARHDGLTQLPNRGEFVKLADRAVGTAVRTGRSAAVLIVDLDRFKQVNDVLGHPVGDRVLVEVARRLEAGVRPGDVVARMGGDEFGVLLPDVDTLEECMAVAERLHQDMRRDCAVEGHRVDLSVSIGAAVAPLHGADFDSLYSSADVAMFVAKRDGAGPRMYDRELKHHAPASVSARGTPGL